MSIRMLVIDDEPLARLGLIARVRRHSDLLLVGECQTAEEALQRIPELQPDVMFLDIEMPGMSGIELLRRLPKYPARHVVFLTAHEEFALHAFDVEALDYLLKPVDAERFEACIERIRRVVQLHRDGAQPERPIETLADRQTGGACQPVRRFTVRRGHEVSFVRAEDIDWIEGMGDYAGLHVQRKTHLIRESLSSLESLLDPLQFLRIHRSTIVQVDRIVRVQPLANRDALLTLRDTQQLRASRSYSAGLQKLLRGTGLG